MVKRLTKLLLFTALLSVGAMRAPAAAGQQDEQSADPDREQARERQAEQEPEQSEDQEESAEEAGEGDGFERFIPTEQVSRDLGVSFPADI